MSFVNIDGVRKNYYGVDCRYFFKDSFGNDWKVFVFPIHNSAMRIEDDTCFLCSFDCYFLNDSGKIFNFMVEMIPQSIYSKEELNDDDFKDFIFPSKEDIFLAFHNHMSSLSMSFLTSLKGV